MLWPICGGNRRGQRLAQASAQAVLEDPGYGQNYGPGNPTYPGYYSNSFAGVHAPGPGVVAIPVRPHRRHHR
jgi:hypothetical protein